MGVLIKKENKKKKKRINIYKVKRKSLMLKDFFLI